MNAIGFTKCTAVVITLACVLIAAGWVRAAEKETVKKGESLPPKLTAKACRATADEMARHGHRREAIQLYERARSLDTKHNDVCRMLAVLYDLERDDKHALEEYQKAVWQTPKDANLLNDLGYFYFRRKDYKRAEQQFRAALKQAPKHEHALTNLALSLGAQGRFESAFHAFEEVVGTAAAHSNVGMLLAKSGNAREAARAFQNALDLDPDLKQAQVGLEVVSKRLSESQQVELATFETDKR